MKNYPFSTVLKTDIRVFRLCTVAQRDRREDILMPSLMSFYKERLSAESKYLLCSNVWGKNTGSLASDMTEALAKK